MPPKGNHMTITPEEAAERQAKNLLYEHGYLYSDSAIPFNVVVRLLKQTILKNQK